jgi:hypothetical protein
MNQTGIQCERVRNREHHPCPHQPASPSGQLSPVRADVLPPDYAVVHPLQSIS